MKKIPKIDFSLPYFYICGSITELHLKDFFVFLFSLKENKKKGYNLIIDSDGGEIESTLGLVDLIRANAETAHGIVVGRCYSSAFALLQACHFKYGLEHSMYMYHHGNTAVGDVDLREAESTLIASLKQAKMLDIVANFSNNEAFERGQFLTTQEALQQGYIDKIVEN